MGNNQMRYGITRESGESGIRIFRSQPRPYPKRRRVRGALQLLGFFPTYVYNLCRRMNVLGPISQHALSSRPAAYAARRPDVRDRRQTSDRRQTASSVNAPGARHSKFGMVNTWVWGCFRGRSRYGILRKICVMLFVSDSRVSSQVIVRSPDGQTDVPHP